jgi:hypothetical protein
MRWLIGGRGLLLAVAVLAFGCGSGGDDELVLAFQGFSGENIEQADSVNPNSADVDVCAGLCIMEDEITAEPFTQTRVDALFVNRGKADIVMDSYTVDVPGSGISPETRFISTRVPGGRCSDNPQTQCAFDDECDESCIHQTTSVEVLLFDFNFKDLVVDGQCPSLEDPAGSVISRTRDVFITFTGFDETEERRTVSTQYVATFTNFDNCPQ